MIEKAIRALSLLEALVRSGCPLIFKGGSALMLHMGCARRLSVDVDIICPPGTDISKFLGTYSEEYGFTSFKEESRETITDIDKTHVKYHYNVAYIGGERSEKILLDVLFEDNHYSEVVQIPISGSLLKSEGEPVMVKVPSLADLFGDKLTAFAPHTCGIPFDKPTRGGTKDCSMEICKQMFDIASLYDTVQDMASVSATFRKFAAVELAYRHLDVADTDAVLRDAFKTALCISSTGQYGDKEESKRLMRGVSQVRSFIHSEKYGGIYATTDAAKVAYSAALIYYGEQKAIKPYDRNNPPAPVLLKNTAINKLNCLRLGNPEALYYWCAVDEILNRNNNGILE